jgi:hypothetical protein
LENASASAWWSRRPKVWGVNHGFVRLKIAEISRGGGLEELDIP